MKFPIPAFLKRLLAKPPERFIIIKNLDQHNSRFVDCEFKNMSVSDGNFGIKIADLTLPPGWQLLVEKHDPDA